MARAERRDEDPLWYKDAVFYEVRVRSFYDSDGDGIGDFRGLTEKLDYLEELGVTTLWLLPFYPSPLRDDGYDISDYRGIHPECGTMADFKQFMKEAHRRNLKVVTELVLNHTSDQHPWFQRARRSPPGSRYRRYYVWHDTADRFREARIIFKDFEVSNWTWDPAAQAYFWHRFYSHQPDLNFDSPEVRREMLKVVDFWLGLGVDGLRLDAVPYLYEREDTSCENLPATHAFLRELREHVDRKFPCRMLLAEANQWPEDAVAYLAEGKECHMAFHFPLMPRMFLALRMEDHYPLTDIWAQTPTLHDSCQWALFLRNHDELTLEMVTEEERDFMYHAYAQERRMRINLGIRRRLAPILGGNRRSIELMNSLLFSLPGTPVLYYGDEIGMGDNIYLGDRNGVRTPMQWSGDRNAGFSRASAQQLILPPIVDHEFHYEAVNVEAQERNRHSLLWWMKRLIALRRRYRAFGRGTIEFLNPDNNKVVAFVRQFEGERVLVVANLSRFVQLVRLDLSAFAGLVPVEAFGNTRFPGIGERPYFFTLGPHGFYWFVLEPARRDRTDGMTAEAPPTLRLRRGLPVLQREEDRPLLASVLPRYLRTARWFAGKTREVRAVKIADVLPMEEASEDAGWVLAQVELSDGSQETYALPLLVMRGAGAVEARTRWPQAVIAELRSAPRESEEEAVLLDGIYDPGFRRAILDLFDRHRRMRGTAGTAQVHLLDEYQPLRRAMSTTDARLIGAEQSNTSMNFGDRFVLKLYRRLDEGPNPELEMGRFLTASRSFTNTPPLAAWIEYRPVSGEPQTLAVLQGFVPNQGDAWSYTLGELRRFYERVVASKERAPELPADMLVQRIDAEPSETIRHMIGAYLEAARLLGRRTAEMHLALSLSDAAEFSPEPYSKLYQRSLYQSLRNLTGHNFRKLRHALRDLPPEARRLGQVLLRQEDAVLRRFDGFIHERITVPRIRCHGDLHLGQVLHTGKDFVFIDFEGEPARPLADRRRKRCALVDVAGIIRSLHYAAEKGIRNATTGGMVGDRSLAVVTRWRDLWYGWTSWSFLRGYLEVASSSSLVPQRREELQLLLDVFLLEKAIYELGYELDSRPDWVEIPLRGLRYILDGRGTSREVAH